MKDGRFDGQVVILTLDETQVRALDAARAWWRALEDGRREPEPDVVREGGLRLADRQRAQLQRRAGVGPRRLLVYESRFGELDCTCGACNIALRFDASHVEVPLQYLMSDAACSALGDMD